MKITRNKGGYVIRVTNTEMALLEIIHSEGMQGLMEQHYDDAAGLSSPEKRILTEIENNKRPWMVVTDDRRG